MENKKVYNTRVSKLREYLFAVINQIIEKKEYQINIDMLSRDAINFSLDKIPTSSSIRKCIIGTETHRDVYLLRSRSNYSQDVINNLENIGFFEKFENIIFNNNRNRILPDIEGIQSISCLSSGTMENSDTDTAEFSIQIQIEYIKKGAKLNEDCCIEEL